VSSNRSRHAQTRTDGWKASTTCLLLPQLLSRPHLLLLPSVEASMNQHQPLPFASTGLTRQICWTPNPVAEMGGCLSTEALPSGTQVVGDYHHASLRQASASSAQCSTYIANRASSGSSVRAGGCGAQDHLPTTDTLLQVRMGWDGVPGVGAPVC